MPEAKPLPHAPVADLHTHSTASDGTLSPRALVEAAASAGVELLALTDHDTTAGLAEAGTAAAATDITFVPGVELSVDWEGRLLHIVGLGIDPASTTLAAGTARIAKLRDERAAEIDARLARRGIEGIGAAAAALAAGVPTRTHFARALLEAGHVGDLQAAFDRYLGRGRAAYVRTRWAELDEALEWITSAGGVAVIAHPLRYKLTGAWMRRLLDAFKAVGGQAMEVATGNDNADAIRRASEFARRFDMLGSVGSDFHSPDQRWVRLGRPGRLPAGIEPVWSALTT